MQWIAALCSDALAEDVTMKTIAKRLAADAIAHGSSDNTTALVLERLCVALVFVAQHEVPKRFRVSEFPSFRVFTSAVFLGPD